MGASFMGPDTDVFATTGTVTGGAAAYTVLSDSDNATYVALSPGQYVWCGMSNPNPAVPTGGTVVKVDLYITAFKLGTTGPGSQVVVAQTTLTVGSGTRTQRQIPPSNTVTWIGAYLVGSYVASDASFAIVHAGTQGSLNLMGVAAVVTWVAKPVTNVTYPNATVTSTNTPTMTWQNTLDPAGGAQFSAETKVFHDGTGAGGYNQGGFNVNTSAPYTGATIVGQTTSWTTPEVLPNDTYRFYERTTQYPYFTVTTTSDWDYEQRDVNVAYPAIPGITATAEPAATPVSRIRLNLSVTAGGASTTDIIQVQRLTDGVWTNIRTILGSGWVTGFPATIYDYEAPVDATVSYRARAIHGFSIFSAWSSTVTATLAPSSWALIHPTDPRLSANIDLRSFGGVAREARQTVKQPLGRSDAVVISDTRGPASGELVIELSNDAKRDTVMALAGGGAPLMLRPASGHHEPSRWVSFGNETISRLVDSASFVERNATYSWTEISTPTGNLIVWGQ